MTDPTRIIQILDAKKLLPNGKILFDHVDVSLAPGESLSLVGKSGSGKSTLLSVLGLLDAFDSGTYLFSGADVGGMGPKLLDRRRGEEIGFIFQRFALIPHLSVLENVMVPLRHSSNEPVRTMREKAMATLQRVDMHGMARKRPRQLSGGEQQRVAIARALVMGPKLILADEPTGSLDEGTGRKIMDLLLEVGMAEGAGLVVVTHDPNVARQTTRSAVMQQGKLVGGSAMATAASGDRTQ